MSDLVRKSVDATVRSNLTAAQGTVQSQSHTLLTREPLVSEIPDQGIVLANVAGTVYIYTRLSNVRYKVAMTLV